MRLTGEMIDMAKSPNGGWTKGQLALIGVEWPPPKGWKSDVTGRDYDPNTIARFIAWHKRGQSK